MNNPHQNARLTVHSREQIVARIVAGQTAAEVAAAFAVSVRTVRKWLARFRAGGGAALSNHASAPARIARRLTTSTVALILYLRRSLRLTAILLGFFAVNSLLWGFVAPMHMRGDTFTATVFPKSKTAISALSTEIYELCRQRSLVLQELHEEPGRLDDMFRELTSQNKV